MPGSVRSHNRHHSIARAAMMLMLYLAAPLLCAAQSSREGFDREGGFMRSGKDLPAVERAAYTGPQPFDIVHYRLDLTFAITSEAMGGTVAITLVPRLPIDSVVLNESALSLDTVSVDGARADFQIDSAAECFTVRLGTLHAAGDTLRIVVAYRRLPGVKRPSNRRGYYYFRPDSVEGLPAILGYTMSEPSDARFWMPCFDDPSEKATAEIHATVPSGYVAASNGILVGVTDNGNGTQTWHWNENHQIATYLMCVTVSEFSVSTYPCVRAANDTVPVQYFVWRPDSTDAARFLPTVAAMLRAFSAIYGPYPFDKYGMSGVVPFAFGGMEHQTMTTLNRFYETTQSVVAHELAHQWWGDLVTCGTWKDIWLNESFATYSEALWQESKGGLPALRSYMQLHLEHFNLLSWTGAVYDPAGQDFNLFDDVVYSKGAWVLHTLRGVVGDSVFFKILAAYRARFAGRSAVTEDLRAVADSVSGMNLARFFNQWVYRIGWPMYAVTSRWGNDVLVLRIFQRQMRGWPVYAMPMQVRLFHGDTDTTVVVQDSLAVQDFAVPLAFAPDSIQLDPDRWIMKQIVSPPPDTPEVIRPVSFSLAQNYPNPFNAATTITYQVPGTRGQQSGGGWVKLVVYDVLGREVATLVNSNQPPGEYVVHFDGSNLASGMYIYRLQAGGDVGTKKMMLLR